MKHKIISALLLLSVVGLHTAQGENLQICVQNRTKSIYAKSKCHAGETRLTAGNLGEYGLQGPQGVPGEKGATGPQGATGNVVSPYEAPPSGTIISGILAGSVDFHNSSQSVYPGSLNLTAELPPAIQAAGYSRAALIADILYGAACLNGTSCFQNRRDDDIALCGSDLSHNENMAPGVICIYPLQFSSDIHAVSSISLTGSREAIFLKFVFDYSSVVTTDQNLYATFKWMYKAP